MSKLRKLSLIFAALLATTGAAHPASATEPPADLCSLLPSADVSKTLGQPYDPPQKSAAMKPYRKSGDGSDCKYRPANNHGSALLFRAYADDSTSVATDIFAKLKAYFGAGTPLPGLGDEAYIDEQHGLHVRKGRVRFFLQLTDAKTFTPANQDQLKDLAARVIAQL